jgi:hypothetical protein
MTDNNNIRIELDSRMFNNFMSLSADKNIVLGSVHRFHKDQLIYVLAQYSQFPRNIVSILATAAYNFAYWGWTGTVNELRDNVIQELGGGGGNIGSDFGPHYSVLRMELEKLFGLDTDKHVASVGTSKFLNNMQRIVQFEPLKAGGAVYALEASAIPELGIVLKLIEHLANQHQSSVSQQLLDFFRFHVDAIEVGHRDRLIRLFEKQFSEGSTFATFLEGYDACLGSMDSWWNELHREAKGLAA